MVMKVNLGTMELEILGMNFGCVLSALSDAKIPEKECLLPLVSKLLGYCIVAASTTVKLPQKPSTGTCLLPGFQSSETLDMNNGSRSASGTTVKILGMDIGYILSASLHTKIPSMDSLLSLLSKVLGYFIIATSTVAKLPQKFNGRACSTRIAWIVTIAERVPDFFALHCRLILKILKHGSVRGLSVPSFELELIGYTISLAYCIHKGLPFSAYGELAFLLIQAIILIAIIYYYSPPMGSKTWMKALVYCGLAPTVLAGKIDPGLFEILYASQHAIFFCARVPQIWKNFTNKSTGELSFLTCFMNFAGSLVRVFTSIQEKTPLSVLMGSAIGIMTNGTILSQIMMYQKPVLKKEKKED